MLFSKSSRTPLLILSHLNERDRKEVLLQRPSFSESGDTTSPETLNPVKTLVHNFKNGSSFKKKFLQSGI